MSRIHGLVRGGLLVCLTAWISGCGGESGTGGSTAATPQQRKSDVVVGGESAPSDMPGGSAPVAMASAEASPLPAAVVSRKIIYTAEVDLVVESLTSGEKELLRLVKLRGGYVAQNTLGGAPGEPRKGTWQLRVPVGQYDTFMAEVSRLGELRRIHSDSQDVSEEFFDLGARLKNKKREEERLLQHLQRSTARLSDILSVERELSRVREEIERMEGRLRFLANQTELTTVTVTMDEVKDYVPPRPTTFGSQIARTFGDSLGVMKEAGKGFVLLLVGLAPWVLVSALIGLPAWAVWRRRRA